MITYPFRIAGDRVEIHVLDPGDRDDETITREFKNFVDRNPVLAIDTETTGLNIYAPDFQLRLAQISNGREAWVLRADSHLDLINYAAFARSLLVHNAGFDLAVLDRCAGVPLDHTCTTATTVDIAVLSRIVDPLGDAVRRSGKVIPKHDLKSLARKHVDPDLDFDKALAARLRALKLPAKSAGGFAAIPIDDPVYTTYAGLDAIVTFRVAETLVPKMTAQTAHLVTYEMELSRLLAEMTRRGILVDVDYTTALLERLRQEWATTFTTVAAHGLDTTRLDTPQQRERFAALLREQGVKLGRTKTGQPALNKQALAEALADSPASEFVTAFFHCRDLEKLARDYARKFLDMRDGADRLHPAIHPMGAQTGRMSISDPPLQQIPRGGDVRGCLVAEPGHVLVSADFSTVEFRVAAALSGDTAMRQAIADGVDLHSVTARRLFGDGFTDEQRNIAKRAGFGRLYGAGAPAVAQQCGVPLRVAEKALAEFDAAFPKVAAFAAEASGMDEVTTPLGRTLPLDKKRSHIGVNYAVQSTARDVFAMAMLRLADAGFRDYLWLPIHDEVIVSVPEGDADEAAKAMADIMADELDGVPIAAEAKVLGRRWRK